MSANIKRIFVLHHTHTDIGYTHSQPMVWRLHEDIIDRALDLCDATASWSTQSQVRWTCEVTATLDRWAEHASTQQRERFRKQVRREQIGAGAFFCNMTPLYDRRSLQWSLKPIARLRQMLGLPFRMAISHDVNGLPWPVVGHLLDAGVDTLMMGINPHFGGYPLRRPMVFDWQGPDGRAIRTLNAEHYSSFGRWLRPQERSTQVMAEGLARYLEVLNRQYPDYPHDFIVLSATHFDFVDNNPPDVSVAEMVYRWNTEAREPRMTFVTSDQLAETLLQLPSSSVPRHAGDWPDYWNFGCAATARETRINRETKARLATVEMLGGAVEADRVDFQDACFNAMLYDEHTWGSWATTWNHEADDVPAGQNLKGAYAYQARALTAWVLRRALDRAVGNDRGEVRGDAWEVTRKSASAQPHGLVVCNPAPLPRSVMLTLPSRLVENRWHHYPSRMHNLDVRAAHLTDLEEYEAGPFALPASGSRLFAMDDLPLRQPLPANCIVCRDSIESSFYRLTFDSITGRIRSLLDKQLNLELVDGESPWAFFGYVLESVDTSRHAGKPKYHGRDALFDTDFEKLSEQMCSGWKPDWPARRETVCGPVHVEAQEHALGPRLIIRPVDAPGAHDLRLTITLPADRKAVMLEACFHKSHTLAPEGVYFTFPLPFARWRAWYDVAGWVAELDRQQLPGAVRDYQTVDTFAAVADEAGQVLLACPDAPMVQFGDFHFGKHLQAVPRDRRCLLLAWPMNTYWDTNFPASQSGFQRFRYELTSAAAFDPDAALAFGRTAATPVEFHPAMNAAPINPTFRLNA